MMVAQTKQAVVEVGRRGQMHNLLENKAEGTGE